VRILYLGGSEAGRRCLKAMYDWGFEPTVGIPGHQLFAMSHPPYDVLISVHSRQIVPKAFLDRLPMGGINLHPNLSTHKGADPIGRAIRDGQTRFSVGAHIMTEVVDGGPLLIEKFVDIPNAPSLTPTEVYEWLYPIYIEVLSDVLQSLSGCEGLRKSGS